MRYLWLLSGLLLAISPVSSQGITRVVAFTGGPGPDGGRFGRLGPPALNESGVVAFHSYVQGRYSGIFQGTGGDRRSPGVVVLVVRNDQPIPGAQDTLLGALRNPAINDQGEVTFVGFDRTTSGVSTDSQGIYLATESTLMPMARTGMTPPEGNGVYAEFSGAFGVHDPALNDHGHLAFFAALKDTARGSQDNHGLYLADETSLQEIVRKGDQVPNRTVQFDAFGRSERVPPPAFNNHAQVAFTAALSDFERGIYFYDGSTLEEVFVTHGESQEGEAIMSVQEPLLNNSGQVAFAASFERENPRSNGNIIFRRTGDELERIVESGQTIPSGRGNFGHLSFSDMNDAGQIAFRAEIRDEHGRGVGYGIFRADGDRVQEIALTGLSPPDWDATYTGFTDIPLINDAGQVAFLARLEEPGPMGGDEQALYFYDDVVGITEVVRTGDRLVGRDVSSIRFYDPLSRDSRKRFAMDSWSPLSNSGMLAYRVSFLEVEDAIVLYEFVPEPSTARSAILLALVCGGMAMRGRALSGLTRQPAGRGSGA